jgi:diacylglycerol kinase (ATP)
VHELVFIINPSSGAGRGTALMQGLASLPVPGQVEMIGDDLPRIAQQACMRGAALIACGGDGTASAVLEAAYQAHLACPGHPAPPVGVLPLGTGNDLARVLGWRPRGQPTPSLHVSVERLQASTIVRLDRWMLLGPGRPRPWYNYWSMGIDARIVARFHDLRRRFPRVVRGSLVNRMLYAALGLIARPDALNGSVALPGNGKNLPGWVNTLVMSSIPSYAGGARLCLNQRSDDGRAEVVALGHGLLLGMATAGLRRPSTLARTSAFTLQVSRSTAMQCDGEPFQAPAGVYRLEHAGEVRVLRAGV